MSISAYFINRPVMTTLLTVAITLAGWIAFFQLPIAPLPQVDFPTISVSAALPGASPETMASAVAAPLEHTLGQIAGITEITSSSSVGSTGITLQFDLGRDIDGAARDVQAAINAARMLLPTSMPTRPSYRKVNPADSPILILALTSPTLTRGQMYDAASTILAQKISQIQGVGQVSVGGSSLPAVRIQLNPDALASYGIGLDEVRQAIATTNVNMPKGLFEESSLTYQLYANDQAKKAADYLPLIIAYRNNAPVRLADVADVIDSVEDIRAAGMKDGKTSVLLIIFKQAGANIIAIVDQIKSLLPQLQASIPQSIDLSVAMDRTTTIRSSLHEVEIDLALAVLLVIIVVLLFLNDIRASLIPIITVPVSLVATFAVLYLGGYSLDNLSLMALTIAAGFVVDDAIVVLENTSRHIEQGMTPKEAAAKSASEVSFTVLSMSLSLIAVFIPILLMGGIVGRLFREFAVTLSAAVLISLAVSLTTTPMLCARWLKKSPPASIARRPTLHDRIFSQVLSGYERSLRWVLRHGPLVLMLLLATIALNIYLYVIVPKGFFPTQDSGRLSGTIVADQAISSQAMSQKLERAIAILHRQPEIETVIGFTGGQRGNNIAIMFATLKPLNERKISVFQLMGRLRGQLAQEPGAQVILYPPQDLRIGGRGSAAMFEYALQSDHFADLKTWLPRLVNALSQRPELADVNTNQQDSGQQIELHIDRTTAARLGINPAIIDATLNNAFGQRQVSVIYNPLNQYHVVMEIQPRYAQQPETLKNLYISSPLSTTGQAAQIPLSAVASYHFVNTPLSVNHQSQFPTGTVSFNLKEKGSLSAATKAVNETMAQLHVPASLRGSFQGTAKAFQQSLQNQPWLILAALLAIYVVLGVLYESYIHPLTILSTLPSAGVGAILALLLFQIDFSIIAMIGVILLIGIVKKNAIIMIDFAIDAERNARLTPQDAIFEACSKRFRPIMMTTAAALLAALPLALGTGYGSEMRQPLGIAIVGGLLLSQVLTLYTTPIIYLYLDRLQNRIRGKAASTAVTRPE